jgi:hypothetical protein
VALAELVHDVMQLYPTLHLTEGRKVKLLLHQSINRSIGRSISQSFIHESFRLLTRFWMQILEIRPLITWNKGKALEYLLKAMGKLHKEIDSLIKFM